MKRIFLGTILLIFIAGNVYGADFTLSIPDEKIPDIKLAYKSEFNYQEYIFVWNEELQEWEEVPNPENVLNFIKRMIKGQVRSVIHNYKTKIKKDAAVSVAYEEAVTETDTIFENVTVE